MKALPVTHRICDTTAYGSRSRRRIRCLSLNLFPEGSNLPKRNGVSIHSSAPSLITAKPAVESAKEESVHETPCQEFDSAHAGDIRIGKAAKNVILIGDIHGQYNKLLDLWGKLEEKMGSYEFNRSKVVFLGDYTDRGPQVREVVEFLSGLPAAMPEQDHVFLCGNHDLGMVAFLGLPPFDQFSEHDSSDTLKGFKAQRGESLWNNGPEDVVKRMHLQGRRWAADQPSPFDSEETFESYGAEYGDREGLLKAVPKHHLDWFSNLELVHICHVDDGHEGLWLIAVHAGLEGTLSVYDQVIDLQNKSCTKQAWIQPIRGRSNVFYTPGKVDLTKDGPEGKYYANNVIVASGHHGTLYKDSRRVIVDTCMGDPKKPLSAMILPSRETVSSLPIVI